MKIAYIVCKDREEALKIGKYLVNKKIIACANIFPIESLYLWKGKLNEGKEFVLIAKTPEKNFVELEKEVKKIHSYEMPCILKIDVKANENYEKWVESIK